TRISNLYFVLSGRIRNIHSFIPTRCVGLGYKKAFSLAYNDETVIRRHYKYPINLVYWALAMSGRD
ncbi:MAG: hypothetical protein LBQ78_02535, partial [Tannerellaceae bacterium]|nr:hypothetical protein [Tannerellaceae bacterium]